MNPSLVGQGVLLYRLVGQTPETDWSLRTLLFRSGLESLGSYEVQSLNAYGFCVCMYSMQFTEEGERYKQRKQNEMKCCF
jgi:hypothetical protein